MAIMAEIQPGHMFNCVASSRKSNPQSYQKTGPFFDQTHNLNLKSPERRCGWKRFRLSPIKVKTLFVASSAFRRQLRLQSTSTKCSILASRPAFHSIRRVTNHESTLNWECHANLGGRLVLRGQQATSRATAAYHCPWWPTASYLCHATARWPWLCLSNLYHVPPSPGHRTYNVQRPRRPWPES